MRRLGANNIQQLVHKGDVDGEGLLLKIRQMLGLEPQITKLDVSEEAQETTQRPVKPDKIAPAKEKKGKFSVLVVEDNPDNMVTVRAILQNEYRVLEAADGKEGLKIALTERPDLVLLDMSLPEMDGHTVVQEIREDASTRHIPVIALTAHAMKGDREKFIEAGCDDYISKPIEAEHILRKLEEWLKR